MEAGWQLLIKRFPDARLLWDVKGPQMQSPRQGKYASELRAYSVNGCVVIVHEYGNGHGWQVYTPVTESGDIEITLGSIYARAHGMEYDYLAKATP